MSRRGQIAKRDVLPDPLYNSTLVTKLINNIMLDGKKGVAQKIVYDAFAIIEEKTGTSPLDVFTEALENVMPVLEVKARRVGGSTYQVPMEVRAERRQTLGLRWLTQFSRTRGERTMAERLAAGPGSKTRGLAGVWVQLDYDVQLVRAVKASCFWPRPEIGSTVVRLVRHHRNDARSPDWRARFRSLTKQAFEHRRKQLGAIFKGMVQSTARAEQLSNADWLAFVDAFPL